MPRAEPHERTLLHLVPMQCDRAREALEYPENASYVSLVEKLPDGTEVHGLEIGYHVASRLRPGIVTEVGRNADLIIKGKTVSHIHFSFEIHPESQRLMLYDRSRHCNVRLEPHGFRADGNFRQVVLLIGQQYTLQTGVAGPDPFAWQFRWLKDVRGVQEEIHRASRLAEDYLEHPRFARTIEEDPTDLVTYYNTRLRTQATGGLQRIDEREKPKQRLGRGAFGDVYKATDLDSGALIAVKEIVLQGRDGGNLPESTAGALLREVKILSSLSHRNIVEYMGSSDQRPSRVLIFMCIKEGNLHNLVAQEPTYPSNPELLHTLLHQMLQALDYLAHRNCIHRDVKMANILYTSSKGGLPIFQLADFGLANHAPMAKTMCGTPLYQPPEVRHGMRPRPTVQWDVWSLAVVFAVFMRVGGLTEDVDSWEKVDAGLEAMVERHDFLRPMAQHDVRMRASAAQMLLRYFNGEGLSTSRGRVGPIPGANNPPNIPARAQRQTAPPRATPVTRGTLAVRNTPLAIATPAAPRVQRPTGRIGRPNTRSQYHLAGPAQRQLLQQARPPASPLPRRNLRPNRVFT